MTTIKRYLAHSCIAVSALVALAACAESEELFNYEGYTASFTLTLPASETVSRATTEAGIDAFNENTINKVDLFFYPAGLTTADAVLRKTFTRVNGLEQTAGSTVATIEAPLSKPELRLIFPDYDTSDATQTCEVYAIVNLPEGSILTATDVASLKQVELSAPVFASSIENTSNSSYKQSSIPTEFVMSGLASNIALAALGEQLDYA